MKHLPALAVVFAATASLAALSEASSASATTSAVDAALARAVASYERSVTSPIVNVDRRLTAVALVEPFVAAPVTIEILGYHDATWHLERRIGLPRYEVFLGPGHVTVSTANPADWLQVFDLGANRPAFAFYNTGASGWGGLVIGKPLAHWEIVPFQHYGTGELSYPEFFSPEDVTTARNNCVPDCAAGTWTWRRFRFAPATSSFVQVALMRTSRPFLPYPKPKAAA
jgi:hypothetical protein